MACQLDLMQVEFWLRSALFNVDKALREAGLTYVRFVDDYRIFAKNAAEAHSALARLMELLGREGLFINSRKSSIERLK